MNRHGLAVAALLAAALPSALIAQQTDEAVVPVTGEAIVRGDSLLAANNAAKVNAYREALRMQLHRLLDSLGANEAFPRLRSRARTYVKAEQVENEERDADTMRVSMRLTLDVAKLKTDLEALGYEIRTVGADHGARTLKVGDVVRIWASPSRNLNDNRVHLKRIERRSDRWRWGGQNRAEPRDEDRRENR